MLDFFVPRSNKKPYVSGRECLGAAVENLPGNQGRREVVHASEVPFRAMVTADMRAWPTRKVFSLEELIGRLVGKKPEGGRGRTEKDKELFAEGGRHVHESGVVAEDGIRAFKECCGLHERAVPGKVDNPCARGFRQGVHDFCCVRSILFSAKQQKLQGHFVEQKGDYGGKALRRVPFGEMFCTETDGNRFLPALKKGLGKGPVVRRGVEFTSLTIG